ncbi:MAG: GNAT family N-acetyltransferase [Xanthobacteraceae bacterium]|nr:MAG: GNAT family N-acetyltransferase [Xanthobacteraceae bacterium]
MLHAKAMTAAEPLKRFKVALARHGDEVREAQRLRWRVFVEEQGARLVSPQPGLDIDPYDAHCEHLIVRDCATDTVVGTYRLLTNAAAKAAGGFYSEQEFDLAPLAPLRPGMVEMGRSCVHPSYRGGVIITLLWSGLGAFLATTRANTLIGCASIPMHDGGHHAVSVYAAVMKTHLSAREHRVRPHHPLPLAGLDSSGDATPPPLIKGYLRAGAVICGAPAWDTDFNTADLFMMLELDRLEQRTARHFRQPAGSIAENVAA